MGISRKWTPISYLLFSNLSLPNFVSFRLYRAPIGCPESPELPRSGARAYSISPFLPLHHGSQTATTHPSRHFLVFKALVNLAIGIWTVNGIRRILRHMPKSGAQ